MLADTSIELEACDAPLGDARLTKRHASILARFAADPAASPPEATGSVAELEAYYRFVRNKRCDHHALLEPHFERAARRAEALGTALVVHDTTPIRFGVREERPRERLARSPSRRCGFEWHASMLVAHDETRAPLGLIASRPFVHDS